MDQSDLGPTEYGKSFAPPGSKYIKTEHFYGDATEVWELLNGRNWFIPLPKNIAIQSQAVPPGPIPLPAVQIITCQPLWANMSIPIPQSSLGPVDLSHLNIPKEGAAVFSIGSKVTYEGRIATILSKPDSLWGATSDFYVIKFKDGGLLEVKESQIAPFNEGACTCGARFTSDANSHMHYCLMYKPGVSND